MSKGTSGSRSPVQSNYGDGHDNDAYNDEYVDENDKKNMMLLIMMMVSLSQMMKMVMM